MNKTLDIKEEIINQRPGIHILNLKLNDVLKEQLNKFKRERLFEKYNMGYIINYNDETISLILHRTESFNEMIKI